MINYWRVQIALYGWRAPFGVRHYRGMKHYMALPRRVRLREDA